MLLGWAIGAVCFGILGDKYGRTRIMFWTIVVYSVCTGLSLFGVSLLFQFLAGLGIGGQFVVVVALMAETMPDRIRPYALGGLYLFSALGSIAATCLAYPVFGVFPAVCAYFVFQYLDESEKWKLAVRDKEAERPHAGSFRKLFGPLHRRQTVLGMSLASTAVIGFWGVGFFSADLYRNIGDHLAVVRLKAEGATNLDLAMIAYLVKYPPIIDDTLGFDPTTLLGDTRYLFEAIRDLRERKRPIKDQSVAEEAINRWNLAEGKGRRTPAIPLDEVKRRKEFFLESLQHGNALLIEPDRSRDSGAELWATRKKQLADYLRKIDDRTRLIEREAASWFPTTALLMNIGAVFGTFVFTMVAVRFGRRPAFAAFLSASILSMVGVFSFVQTQWGIYTLVPLMGFCLLSLLGGCTIYLPELFPTQIRSTAIAVCCSTGFFLAACCPFAHTVLKKYVYTGFVEPIRWAGITMSGIFLIGIVVIWMLPETKDQPLPS